MKIIRFLLIKIALILSHSNDAYYNDDDDLKSNTNWMSMLPDNLSILNISIPGTHNSASRTSGNYFVKCQSLTIEQQLNAGIRFLDLRLRHIENVFALHHDIIFLKLFFGDVLNLIENFLIKNPTETILIRAKEEYKPHKNNRSFNQTFESYFKRYQKVFWKGSTRNPTIGDLRGKILLIKNFASETLGLEYNQFEIQDDYYLNHNWKLYNKWLKVKAHLLIANSSYKSTHNGFINYLSGSGWSFPFFVASGHVLPLTRSSRLATGLTIPGWRNIYPEFPRVNCFIGICTIAFEGTNLLAKNLVQNLSFVGIVVADFPGQGLIQSIIDRNFI
ncbi:unnamed protein product [Brachionus calyciflorus]|uniref:Phosphatidylinositol-specific phospholipase C X domain-containing protein n=1 Tax=Brachionus calyciflorus TaxID=104777 RepID=A0A813MFC6_9BILA|nr:unnamed protein product [Brachionus calyciflorus]